MRQIELNRDYILYPSDDPEHVAFKLIDGPYEGIVYIYNTVSVLEDKDSAKLKFTYKIISGDQDIITSKEHFQQYIGDLLVNYLTEVSKAEVDYKDENGNTTREPDLTKLDSQRSVSETGDPVSED